MSKSIAVVAVGAASLQQLAASLIGKATKGAANAVSASTAASNAVVVGATPRGAHTAVTCTSPSNGPYAGVKTTFVRAILPRGADDVLQLRDAVDVLPSAGANADAEAQAAKESYVKSAKIVAELVKNTRASKVTLVLKQQTKFAENNRIFTEAAKEVLDAQGIHSEIVSTATAANTLVLFPETLGVVFTNDTPSTENVELAFAGLLGGAARRFYTEDGGNAFGGHSSKSVAHAVAQSLRCNGFTAEAKALEDAAAQSKSGKDLAAL
jgi:hypothetical protein